MFDTNRCRFRFHRHKLFALGQYRLWFPDMPLLFPDLVPGSVSLFFTCYIQPLKRITYGSFATVEFFGDLLWIRIRMFCYISLQFFRVYLFIWPHYRRAIQVPLLLPLFFPFAYRADCCLEHLVCFLQRMPFLSIFYCPFPVVC